MPEFLQYGFMHRAFAAGVVTALICPAIGVFLIPRRLSLIADTLAHVALAGVALGLVLVSHDIGVVAKQVTKLACLNRRLIFHGRPGDFLSDAALTALYGPSVRIVSHDH